MLTSAGINLRYLGRIRVELQKENDEYWSSMLLLEMVARIIKHGIRSLLRENMKKYIYPGEVSISTYSPSPPLLVPFHEISLYQIQGIYNREVIRYLNLVFGSSSQSSAFWNDTILSAITLKYQMIGIMYVQSPLSHHLQ